MKKEYKLDDFILDDDKEYNSDDNILEDEIDDYDDIEDEMFDSVEDDNESYDIETTDEDYEEDAYEVETENDSSFDDEEQSEREALLEPEGPNRKLIITISLLLLLIVIVAIIFFVTSGKKDGKKTSNSNSSANSTNSSNIDDEELDNQDITNLYGKKVLEEIKSYYDLNGKLPLEIPELKIEEHTVFCEINDIYTPEYIYLGNCSVDDSEAIYSFGNKLVEEEKDNSNTNSNSDTNSNSNLSNSNTISNKPSNTNTNSNKPTNTNSNSNVTNPKPQTVTTGSVSNSGSKKSTPTTFGDFTKVVSFDKEESTTYQCTYEKCYSGNGGNIAYASDGSMVFNDTNPIVYSKLPKNSNIVNQYSVNITVKGDPANQIADYGGVILGISKTDANYLAWVGYKEGNLVVYSYVIDSKPKSGVVSIPFTNYNNKIVNIQVVAQREKDTIVYINGKEEARFPSGTEVLPFEPVTLGDLRPGRGLKFRGNIYEAVVYDRLLTPTEITTNYEAAKEKYNIK